MMEIETVYFGMVTIEEEKVITFKEGLPGLEDCKRFALFPIDEEGVYFALQSTEEQGVALVVTSPYMIEENYEIEISDHVQEELEIEKQEDVIVYNVVTLKDPFATSTINLQAPIVIHKDKRKARQVILNDEAYDVRRPLFPEGGDTDARTE